MKPDTRWIAGGLLLTLLAVNALVVHKEWILRTGRPLLLELAPVDPRSLIQGDYMRLQYRVARDASTAPKSEGTLLLTVDEAGVGHYLAHDSAPVSSDQLLLGYRRGQFGALQVGAGAFFFQEGLASAYAQAKFGEFRVSPGGKAVLIGLRDSPGL